MCNARPMNMKYDNWKCQRIFQCRTSTFEKCVADDGCLKEQGGETLDDRRHYVVFNKWYEVPGVVKAADVFSAEICSKLKTPKGQHNPVRLSEDAMRQIQRILQQQ